MRKKADIVRGLLRKAASDVVTMDAAMGAGAFDGSCFHAQQAAEKYLKAFLVYYNKPFPFTHNLADLTELCSGVDVHFRTLSLMAAELTPYGVRLQYDDDFWPTVDAAKRARAAALTIRDAVLQRLPLNFLEATR